MALDASEVRPDGGVCDEWAQHSGRLPEPVGIPYLKGVADISMHGDEAKTPKAKGIIELEGRLERGDAHGCVVMAQPSKNAKSERSVSLA